MGCDPHPDSGITIYRTMTKMPLQSLGAQSATRTFVLNVFNGTFAFNAGTRTALNSLRMIATLCAAFVCQALYLKKTCLHL
jgi:hypothetical protein